jgi:hypothetical protein
MVIFVSEFPEGLELRGLSASPEPALESLGWRISILEMDLPNTSIDDINRVS